MKVIHHFFLCVFLLSWIPLVQAQGSNDLTVVYIHGFGGAKEKPQFCKNLKAFFKDLNQPCVVENYTWDSVKVDVLKAGASWLEAEKKADLEAKTYKVEVIDRLEKSGTPYVLVGYSVGSRVVLRALEEAKGHLKELQGVYFLGSAMTRDTTMAKNILPGDMKIINYHSPVKDTVHQLAFSFMNSVEAGGRVGFDDADVFDNHTVSCTHTHKKVGVTSDYSQLANAIGYISLFRQGIEIPGKTKINLVTKAGEGDLWWNTVLRWPCKLAGKRPVIEFEQNCLKPDYFRAVMTRPDGKRKRVARGNNLHAILKKLKAEPVDKSGLKK